VSISFGRYLSVAGSTRGNLSPASNRDVRFTPKSGQCIALKFSYTPPVLAFSEPTHDHPTRRLQLRMKAFLDTLPSPSAISPTRISPRQPSRCGRSHATRGSPCRPTCRPSTRRSRGDKKKQTFHGTIGMSALPPKADICGALAHVRFGPTYALSALRTFAKCRFPPKTEIGAALLRCPLRVKSRHLQRNKACPSHP
jgi:hypothetical protein